MPCAKKGAGRSTTTVKFVPLVSGRRADCANISRDPVSRPHAPRTRETRRRLHDTRHPCDGGDDDHCAMRGGTHPRGPRARPATRGRAPRRATPRLGPRGGRARRALRPRRGTTASAFGDPGSRVAAVERASTRALPRRAGWRRERAPPRASRGAPRAGRTREPNRGGAPPNVSPREESRGGGERVRAKRGFVYIRNFFSALRDRATHPRAPPRARLRAIYSAPRLEIARTTTPTASFHRSRRRD